VRVFQSMAVTSTEGTDQHYVPQFLLRGFASTKRKQVYVFDKSNDNEFRSSVRNLACQRDFYDPELDEWLRLLEEWSAPIIQSIRAKKTLRHLGEAEKRWLASFVAVQQVRTVHQRAVLDHINKSLVNVLRETGADPNSLVEGFHEMTDFEVREHTNASMKGLAFDLLPYVLKKDWILFSAAHSTEFWIADHPVTLANNLNPGDGFRGTLGFGVPGIEIYLPLSSDLMLGCLCPTIQALMFASLQKQVPGVPRADEYLKAFAGLTTLQLQPENVEYHNSLQVLYAERFIYSEHGAFGMAREMISCDESLRKGRRPERVRRGMQGTH